MTAHGTTELVPRSTGDIAELYAALSTRLERIVRLDVAASEPIVEDACQFAWDRLLSRGDRVRRETVLPWLARTAVREALKLLRREQRDLSLDAPELGGSEARTTTAGPEELVLHRERIGLVSRLPPRQRRIMWLHALGLSYVEIALETGCTARTVERQLLRAKRTVRAAA